MFPKNNTSRSVPKKRYKKVFNVFESFLRKLLEEARGGKRKPEEARGGKRKPEEARGLERIEEARGVLLPREFCSQGGHLLPFKEIAVLSADVQLWMEDANHVGKEAVRVKRCVLVEVCLSSVARPYIPVFICSKETVELVL